MGSLTLLFAYVAELTLFVAKEDLGCHHVTIMSPLKLENHKCKIMYVGGLAHFEPENIDFFCKIYLPRMTIC